MQKGLIAINGKVYPSDEALISPLDRGFLFADNVFEVFAGFNDKLLDTLPHLIRLRKSASEIGLEIPWSDAELEFELLGLLKQLNCPKAYLRLVVTRGYGLGLDYAEQTPNRITYCFAAKPLPDRFSAEGISLYKVTNHKDERQAAIKTANYLLSIVALAKAKNLGFDDVLFVNASREVQEASTANIFFLGQEEGKIEIATPSLRSGILKGITRDRIIHLLSSHEILVEEKIIFEDELPRYDEAFLCSTVKGLIPIARIGDHKFHFDRKGSIFKTIEALFLNDIAKTLGHLVEWNTGRVN